MSDPYQVLGVAPGASPQTIKAAWRKLAQQHHPDKNPNDPTAVERFKQVQAAYDMLRDDKPSAAFSTSGSAYSQTSGRSGTIKGRVMLTDDELASLHGLIRLMGAEVNVYTLEQAVAVCVAVSHWWAEPMANNPYARLKFNEKKLFGSTYIMRVREVVASIVTQQGLTGRHAVNLQRLPDTVSQTLNHLCTIAGEPPSAAARRRALAASILMTGHLVNELAKGADMYLQSAGYTYRAGLWPFCVRCLNPQASNWQKTSPHKRTWWRKLARFAGLDLSSPK